MRERLCVGFRNRRMPKILRYGHYGRIRVVTILVFNRSNFDARANGDKNGYALLWGFSGERNARRVIRTCLFEWNSHSIGIDRIRFVRNEFYVEFELEFP